MKNGLNILVDSYWANGGWKDGTISKEDFQQAKKEGFMFDYPEFKTHDEVLKKLELVLSRINPDDVANAFLYSLSTRKLEYRSALGSYYYAKAIPKHKLEENVNHCYLCGWYAWKKSPSEYDLKTGINVFNFERYKFGGVRHTSLDYALFDLEQFLKLPKVTPNDEDKKMLCKLLKCINNLEGNEKINKLRDVIIKEKIIKCNRNEVDVILDILGICGILQNKTFPCYEEKFVDEYERAPIEYKNDFTYPANRWCSKDGINYKRFEKIFKYKIID